ARKTGDGREARKLDGGASVQTGGGLTESLQRYLAAQRAAVHDRGADRRTCVTSAQGRTGFEPRIGQQRFACVLFALESPLDPSCRRAQLDRSSPLSLRCLLN